jgi:hypothetical protein
MRRGVLTRLVLLALVAPALAHSAAQAGKDNKQQPVASAVTFTKEVEGKSRVSFEEAIESALQTAADEVHMYLQEQKPALIWQPTAGYVREHLLDDLRDASNKDWTRDQIGDHTILVQKTKFGVADEPFTYQVRLQVVVTPKGLADMRQLDEPRRKEVYRSAIQQRQVWLVKILVCVVALLTGISGYIRLEDATKGYYTGWLRLGMVGVLCAVGAGLWLVK